MKKQTFVNEHNGKQYTQLVPKDDIQFFNPCDDDDEDYDNCWDDDEEEDYDDDDDWDD